jgi:hypothetical protein
MRLRVAPFVVTAAHPPTENVVPVEEVRLAVGAQCSLTGDAPSANPFLYAEPSKAARIVSQTDAAADHALFPWDLAVAATFTLQMNTSTVAEISEPVLTRAMSGPQDGRFDETNVGAHRHPNLLNCISEYTAELNRP